MSYWLDSPADAASSPACSALRAKPESSIPASSMIPRCRIAKLSTAPRLLLTAACALLSACGGESTAPTPHVELVLTGAAAPTLEHSTYPDGSWRVDCGEQVTAELRGDAGASIVWDGMSVTW